jgi:hypothetical protein
MIEVKYVGGLGNNLFQYAIGRILAEELGYELKADPIKGFPKTYKKIKGKNYSNYKKIILEGQKINIKKILNSKEKNYIILDGYFQRYEYYEKHKNKIKNWFKFEKNFKKNKQDILLNIRRGDFVQIGQALPKEYYEKALSKAKYEKIYITTDDSNDPFVKYFVKKYDAIITNNNYLDDFRFISSFDKIIMSQSTFCWWATFLSNAKEIYFPIPKKGYWSLNSEVDLRVDEKRYKYIKLKYYYKMSFFEFKFYIFKRIRKKMMTGLKMVVG